MKKFILRSGRLVAVAVAVTIGLLLLVTAITMLSDYKKEISERAFSRAQYNTVVSENKLLDEFDKYKIYASQIAFEASKCINEAELIACLDGYVGQDDDPLKNIKDIKYYVGENVFYATGMEVQEGEAEASRAHHSNPDTKKIASYIGSHVSIYDNMIVNGFYAPVNESAVTDAIVVYYTRDQIENLYSPELKNANGDYVRELEVDGEIVKKEAEFSVLVDNQGSVIVTDKQYKISFATINLEKGTVITDILKVLSPSDGIEVASNLREDFKLGRSNVYTLTVGTEDCVLSVGTCDQMTGLYIVELSKVSNLCEAGLSFVNSVIAIIIIFTIIAIVLIVYLIVYNLSVKKKLLNLESTHPLLECNNRNGFEKVAKDILDRNPGSYFACMVLEIRHFKFIQETTNESEVNALLRYLKYALSTFTLEEETYGYIDDGEFLLFIHAKNKEGIVDRLKVFNSVINKNRINKKLDVLIKYGIYEVDKTEKLSISKMIDFAHEANNTISKNNDENAVLQFNFYDSELRKIRIINEDMELRMESALLNGEFQVFYQPKYNLNLNRQDGAEALVRWYDKETGVYNRPDLFMALFESNGFVVKIDKYVFERVCEYINYSVAHGRNVYPISVNISRVTAIQPDFVDYYTRIKKKYGISDGQIMIEFTESFAYENYEMLYKIVEDLHNAGFKCSIDDFGCGYSSYRILKSLPMDEIKLDKFFMEKGLDDERDNSIFDSIIRLAKKLKMKVTQEGVETQDGVDRLRTMGCDVIQGYIYAYPMALSDYIKFVQTSREHNLK